MFKICFDKCMEWYLHISFIDKVTHVVKIMLTSANIWLMPPFFLHFLQIFLVATSLLVKFQANSIRETVGKIGANIGHLKHFQAQSCEKSCRYLFFPSMLHFLYSSVNWLYLAHHLHYSCLNHKPHHLQKKNRKTTIHHIKGHSWIFVWIFPFSLFTFQSKLLSFQRKKDHYNN